MDEPFQPFLAGEARGMDRGLGSVAQGGAARSLTNREYSGGTGAGKFMTGGALLSRSGLSRTALSFRAVFAG
jgi:hypothetical protein